MLSDSETCNRQSRGLDSQVFSHRDMGMFQDVTTSTMERGISTLRGFTTVISLHNHRHILLGNTVLGIHSFSPDLDGILRNVMMFFIVNQSILLLSPCHVNPFRPITPIFALLNCFACLRIDFKILLSTCKASTDKLPHRIPIC